jgi:hypothetical protein
MQGRGHCGDLAMLNEEDRPVAELSCTLVSSGAALATTSNGSGDAVSVPSRVHARRTGDTFAVSRCLASLAKVLIATINEKYTVFFMLGKRHSSQTS